MIGYTKSYSDDDERKFRCDTPARLLRAYVRVWEGCPSLERIQADIGRFLKAVLLVKVKRGIVLNDGGYARAGRRKELSERSSNWGGLRFKMELQAGKWVHTDAEDGKKALRSKGK